MNNFLYYASKCLKRTFEKNSQKIGSIKCGPGKNCIVNTVYVQDFTSKYSKRTSEKSQMK